MDQFVLEHEKSPTRTQKAFPRRLTFYVIWKVEAKGRNTEKAFPRRLNRSPISCAFYEDVFVRHEPVVEIGDMNVICTCPGLAG
jgi:hypothetical protein